MCETIEVREWARARELECIADVYICVVEQLKCVKSLKCE